MDGFRLLSNYCQFGDFWDLRLRSKERGVKARIKCVKTNYQIFKYEKNAFR